MSIVPITTERLRIRALANSDLDAVFAIVGDEAVADGATWLQRDLKSCRAYVERRIADEAEHGFSVWAVERIYDRQLIGLAGFFPHGARSSLGTRLERTAGVRATAPRQRKP